MFGPQISACDVVLPGEGRSDGTIGTGWSCVAALKVERDGVGLGEQHRFAWCRVGKSANAAGTAVAAVPFNGTEGRESACAAGATEPAGA
jgi:hypothetical protein